nr:hypothetical protein [Nocardia vaccinii]
MASAQRQPVPMIAKLMQVSESYVQQRFQRTGVDRAGPKMERGQAGEDRSGDT